jgi:hypothetical protein
MKNHGMMEYGFVEATAFEGVMPKAAEKIGTVGASDVVVGMHGMAAKGMDALEVIDVQAAFEGKVSDEEGGESGDEGEVIVEPDFVNNDDVTLGADYAPAETVVIETGSKTLNLNGKAMTAPVFVDESDNSSNSYGFWVKGGELTIDGEGEIVAQEAKYSMAVWANGGTVRINGGTFRNGGDSCDLIYASNGGRVEIYGGEFIANGPASGTAPGTKNPYVALNVKDRDRETSSIEVFGGRFFKFNPADNLSEGEHTNFVAPGYKVVEEGDWFVVMPE